MRRTVSWLLGLLALLLTGPAAADDGPRVRAGLAGAFGGAAETDNANSGVVFGGGEAHVGVQIDDLVALYAVPRIAVGQIGVGSDPALTGFTVGLLGVTALVDFTLADRFFVGAGGGFAQYQIGCIVCVGQVSSGGVIHARMGGYPVVSYDTLGAPRLGLMVGAELRASFLAYPVAPGWVERLRFIEPSLTVGVEAF